MKLCNYCGGSISEVAPASSIDYLTLGSHAFCDADCAAKRIAELETAMANLLKAIGSGIGLLPAVTAAQKAQTGANGGE